MDSDDDLCLALSFHGQLLSQLGHIQRLSAHLQQLQTEVIDEYDSSSSEEECPGKGFTVYGIPKSPYMRRPDTHRYNKIRYEDTDVALFEKITHFSFEEFDALHDVCHQKIREPFDVRQQHSDGIPRLPRKRRLSTREMLFFFFEALSGANEGGQGVRNLALEYGLSPGTVSNYFQHVLFALFTSLDSIQPRLIRWPTAEERASMHGLIRGFPKCVFFVDGNKNKRWRPGDPSQQEMAYDGYKKSHCFALIIYCDIFGKFIRVEITEKGSESDRNMYKFGEIYRNKSAFLSEGEHGMADMGFAGDGELVVPFKLNESTEWIYRGEYNRDIRSQRMVNEWGIGYVNNRHRLFLGRLAIPYGSVSNCV